MTAVQSVTSAEQQAREQALIERADEKRQEFVLLSDALGASMQTIAINNEAYPDATEATVTGPFFVEGTPLRVCFDIALAPTTASGG